MDSAFQFDQYVLKKQFLALTGVLRIYSSQGQLVLYSQQKFMRLKEDIRIYTDETKNRELLNIQARQIIDFSAYYDVVDSQFSAKVGGLRRKGFRSLVQDEWEIFDAQDQPLGILKEDSLNKALLRRLLLGKLLPQEYSLTFGLDHVADYKQEFHLFHYVLDIDFTSDVSRRLDRRLGLAAAILLAIIEGRQHRQE